MAEVEVVVAKPEESCEWSVGFLIGVDGASNPFTPGGDISPELSNFGLRICTCYENMNAVDPEVSIPTASLEAVEITEEECRAMLRDVAETLNSRSRCSWNLGWLGPIMLIFWWGP